jgi:hypothetical protein
MANPTESTTLTQFTESVSYDSNNVSPDQIALNFSNLTFGELMKFVVDQFHIVTRFRRPVKNSIIHQKELVVRISHAIQHRFQVVDPRLTNAVTNLQIRRILTTVVVELFIGNLPKNVTKEVTFVIITDVLGLQNSRVYRFNCPIVTTNQGIYTKGYGFICVNVSDYRRILEHNNYQYVDPTNGKTYHLDVHAHTN